MKLLLNLDFFAAFLQVQREEVSYALLKVTEGEVTQYRPVVAVSRYQHYVYDLKTAQFISSKSTDEEERVLEPATDRKGRRGIILKSNVSDAEEVYTTLDFYDTFKTMVANDFLN